MATVVFGDFEWDSRKASGNQRKHGVSFEEASTIFADAAYILRPDTTNPDRFHGIGISAFARILTVVHLERGPRIRIISARKATNHEKEAYSRRR
ncbi:MAG TPA: BrnT family toxin [Polyangiaceae bacterium]